MTYPATAIPTDFFSGLGNIAGDAAGSLRDVLNGARDRMIGTDLEFWIDPDDGDDATADGTEAKPFKTWAALQASQLIPRVILEDVRVKIKPGRLNEQLSIVNYVVAGSLVFEAVPDSSPFPSTPFPFDLFIPYLQPITGTTGPTSGTATGGTKRRINLTAAGWTVDEMRGKFFLVVAGTNFLAMGRVVSNGTDYLEVSGLRSAPYDATTEFVLAEEPVTFHKPDDESGSTLFVRLNSGAGSIQFRGIRVEIQDHQFAFNAAQFGFNTCGINFNYSSMIGNTAPPLAGASQQVLFSLNDNIGFFSAFSSDFFVPNLDPGTFSGVTWAFGPNGQIGFSSCSMNDNVQIYYGCLNLVISNCGQRYRTGMLELNVVRSVSYFQYLSSWTDANGVTNLWRFDGHNGLDCRDSLWENAPGDGIISFGHHADGVNLYFARTEINGCGGAGIRVKGNSVVAISSVTTDGSNLNGTFGIQIESGSQLRYTGTNTVRGSTGDVNLGDGATAVPHATPATDITHLTRLSAF